MKNLMLSMTFFCIVCISCSKEDVNEQSITEPTEAAYVLKLSEGNKWEAVFSSELQDNINTKFSSNRNRNRNSLHAHGDFSGFNGGHISFSGTQNTGGAHGSAALEVTFGPFGTANVVLETVSVISIGDHEAVYGGQITEVLENTVMFPPPPPGFPLPPCEPYEVGTFVYFAVKDNGQGFYTPADQYSPLLANRCFEDPSGSANIPWSFFGFIDVESPQDKIKVNY